ncbi:hypothetical protein [Kribbella monticola]|uniref:hypothetical protein n=1 Tax=Kribbella monticola TaxID=2185285 RepID=UPI0013003754|nr:hypothetical protein [Kribbella monticola]
MRAETSATSAVVTLGVAVAVGGHVLVSGASVPLAVVPQLLALAAACWLLGEFVAGRRAQAVGVLAAVQLVVHLTLNSTHSEPVAQAHEMPMDMAMPMDMPMPGATESPAHSALTMTATHLLALLAGIFVVGRAHDWAVRVLRILARLVPELPGGLVVVPAARRPLTAVPEPSLTQRWLNSNGSRRGPPVGHVLFASS